MKPRSSKPRRSCCSRNALRLIASTPKTWAKRTATPITNVPTHGLSTAIRAGGWEKADECRTPNRRRIRTDGGSKPPNPTCLSGRYVRVAINAARLTYWVNNQLPAANAAAYIAAVNAAEATRDAIKVASEMSRQGDVSVAKA